MSPLSHRPFLLWLVLPAALFLLTLALCGAYFESNDDAVLALLLRGEMAAAPVSDFQYYLHGLGHFLAGLYGQFPAMPWYGLVLYALLFLALVLSAYFLFKIWQTSSAKSGWLWLVVAALFLASWTEHIMWFSFVRVAILLAGAALLAFAASSGKNKLLLALCLIGVLLALCLRPRAAFLGLACVLPALYWLLSQEKTKPKNALLLLWPFVVVLLAFQFWLSVSASSEQKELRKINRLKSELVEYNRLVPAPQNQPDSLAIAAVQNWFLADRETITSDLFARATKPAGTAAFLQQAPKKLTELLITFGKDYFLLIFLQAVFVALAVRTNSDLPNKKLFVFWQVLFWFGLLALGVWLKLPPRVATACISLHLLAATGVLARFARVNPGKTWWLFLAFGLLGLLQLYKIVHRIHWQQNARKQHEQFLSLIPKYFARKTLVTAQLGEQMSSLSPFRNYSFGNNQILRISGWPTLLPDYPQQLKSLTGKTDFAGAIQVLAARESTLFLMPEHFPVLLQEYLQIHHDVSLHFERQGGFPAGLQEQGYGVYRANLQP